MNPFAFRVDYAAAIADDRRDVAFLSSPLAIAIAAFVDAHPECQRPRVYEVMLVSPEVRALSGLAPESLRAMLLMVTADEVEASEFGPERPGDAALAKASFAARAPDGSTWQDFIGFNEAARSLNLKKAKAALARHSRNAR